MWQVASRVGRCLDGHATGARRILVPLIVILAVTDVILATCLALMSRPSGAGASPATETHVTTPCPAEATDGTASDGASADAAPKGGELRDALQRQMVAQADGDYAGVAGWTGSMPTTGEGRILMLRVSFPNGLTDGGEPLGYYEGDSLAHLQAIIGGDGTASEGGAPFLPFPYESLGAYYLRSSYGRLHVTGDAYDYDARLPRGCYDNDIELLFHEALDALDPQIDYADYDGDGDGTIDCVCLRFAGEDTGWGTTWWSHAFGASSCTPPGEQARDDYLDGMSLDSLIMLHTSSATTLIHEVGHAMGLPDYYHKSDGESDGSDEGGKGSWQKVGGIGMSDMMNNNTGDHNAFSKWMLGWIDDAHVAKVTCDGDGTVTATIGDQVMRGDGDGHVRVPVGSFSGEGDGGLCRAVAIYPQGDDGRMGPFSDCYVLQYEVATGNQWSSGTPWVMEHMRAGDARGFRLLRVQGTLDGGVGTMRHDDTYDPRHDQLIEAVSALEGGGTSLTETSASGLLAGISADLWTPSKSPEAGMLSMSGFHSSLFQLGDEATPGTTPSTDLGEGEGARRTGICLRVIETDEEQGMLDIWYEG